MTDTRTDKKSVERLAKTADLFAKAMKAWQHKTQKHNEDVRDTLLALRDKIDALEAKLDEAQAPDISALRNHGFAPGSYHCFCSECGKTHTADKRAWRCLECAEKHVAALEPSPITPAEAAEVLLEDFTSEDGDTDYKPAWEAAWQALRSDKTIYEAATSALRAIAAQGREDDQ